MSIIGGNTSFWLEGPENRLKYFGQRCPLGALIPQLSNSTIICKNGGIAWLVAPISTEVSRTWYCREDAVTRAIAVTSVTTGWFVPCIGQLQNPGYLCRSYWDSYSSTFYWSSTSFSSSCACRMSFNSGGTFNGSNPCTYCVRAFRCVTY
jgi:hypothetical protein